MAEYATSTDIANRALQLCGAALIPSLGANTRNAVQANFLYDKIRVAELRAHVWNFAVNYQVILGAPAATITYNSGETRKAYNLAAGFLRLAAQEPRFAGTATQPVSGGIRFSDLTVERGQLVTAQSTPITIRYVSDITTVTLMDPLFIEALAIHLAKDLVEILTNNSQKKQLLTADYNEAIATARAINLIEAASDEPAEPDWKQDRLLREKAPPPQQRPQR